MERSVDRTPWDDDCPLSLSLPSFSLSLLSFLPLRVCLSPALAAFLSPSFSFLHGFILYSAWRKRDAGVAEPRTADFLRPRSLTPRSSEMSSKMVFKLNSFLLENIDLCFGNYAETGIRYFEYIPSYIPSYTVS